MDTPTDIRILPSPRPLTADHWRREPAQVAWRWRFQDPRSGEMVDPSEPLTPAEVFQLNPAAELIPGSRTVRPEPLIQLWR